MSKATRTTLRLGLAAAFCLLALAPAAAQAQRSLGTFFPAQAIDGPSEDIRAVGDIDMSRDGVGLLTFVRRVGGEDHVFASLIEGGAAQGAFQVDGGQGPVIGLPTAATANGGRMVVAFANGAGVWVAVRAGAGQAFSPLQQLAGPGARDPSVDLSINGVGYVVWAHDGDVRSAHLDRRATIFGVHPAPLDALPARWAGSGSMRPRVSASSDGLGLAVWGEADESGLSHVVVRRLVRGRTSLVAAGANATSIDGLPAGSADMPDLGFEDDSSYAWVVFRQQMTNADGSVSLRALARRLRGSAFEGPTTIDAGAALGPHSVPRVGLNGRGQGIATVEAQGSALASVIKDDVMATTRGIGAAAGVPAQPVAGFAENFDGAVAWLQPSAVGATELRARVLEDDIGLAEVPPFGPDALLSDPALGPVDAGAGIDADVTRAGDTLVAFIQENSDGRRLVLAAYDRAPGAPSPTTSTGWKRTTLPTLSWAPSFDVFGGITYSLVLDGQPLGETTDTRFTPPAPIADGIHRWQVIATDRRGQVVRASTRNLRIDGTRPTLKVKVSGKRTAGRQMTFAVQANDLRSPAGSGVRKVRIDFRDRTLPRTVKIQRPTFKHVFVRKGTYKVRISATDGAGNFVVLYRTIKVKAPPKKKKKKGKKKKTAKPKPKPTPPKPTPTTPEPTTPEPTTPVEPIAPGEPPPDPGGTGARATRR